MKLAASRHPGGRTPAAIVVAAIVAIPTVIIHNACHPAASRPFCPRIVVALVRQRICIAAFGKSQISQFLSEMSDSGDTGVAISENTSFGVGKYFCERVDEQVNEGRRGSASDGN
jgi:hypothetical protein